MQVLHSLAFKGSSQLEGPDTQDGVESVESQNLVTAHFEQAVSEVQVRQSVAQLEQVVPLKKNFAKQVLHPVASPVSQFAVREEHFPAFR